MAKDDLFNNDDLLNSLLQPNPVVPAAQVNFAPGTQSSYIIPVPGEMAGGFADPRDKGTRQHKGGDILAAPGTPVVAPSDMEYIAGGTGGNKLRDNDSWAHFRDVNSGKEFRFAHIAAPPDLKPGQVVPRGTAWGAVGSAIDNPHLHMSVVDPEKGHIDWPSDAGLSRGDKIGGPEQPQGQPTDYKSLAEKWKENPAALQAMAGDVADHYGIPRDIFKALVGHESSWNPLAQNPKSSATGIGQFLDKTAKNYFDEPISSKGESPNDPRYHPGKSLDAAARLLRDNYNEKGNWADAIKAYGEGTDEYLQRVARQWKKDQAAPVSILGSIPAGLQEGIAKTAGTILSLPARGAEYLMGKAGEMGFPEANPEELRRAREIAQATEGGVERAINPNPYGPSQGFIGNLVRGLASGGPELAGLALASMGVPEVAIPAALAKISPLVTRLLPAMAKGAGTFGLWDIMKGQGPQQAAIGAGMGAALPFVGPEFGRLARLGYGGAVGGGATLAQTLAQEGRLPTAEELGQGAATMGLFHAMGRTQKPYDPLANLTLDLSQFVEVPRTPPAQGQLPGPGGRLALPAPPGYGPGERFALPPGPTVSGPGFDMSPRGPEVRLRPGTPYDYTQDPLVNAVTAPANYPPVLETIPGNRNAMGLRPQDIMERLISSATGMPETTGLRSGPSMGVQLPTRFAEMPTTLLERRPVAAPEKMGESISPTPIVQPAPSGEVLPGARLIKPLGLTAEGPMTEGKARDRAQEVNGYAFRFAGSHYVSLDKPPLVGAKVEVTHQPEIALVPITNKERVKAAVETPKPGVEKSGQPPETPAVEAKAAEAAQVPTPEKAAPAPETVAGGTPKVYQDAQGWWRVEGTDIKTGSQKVAEQAASRIKTPAPTIAPKEIVPPAAGGEAGIPPTWDVVDKYQWMANKEGGQTQGNKMILIRVSPETYKQFVQNKLRGKPTLNVAKNKGWISPDEGIQLVDKGNGWEVSKVGAIDTLRPKGEATQWAKKVDDFASPEAVEQRNTFDSEPVPEAKAPVEAAGTKEGGFPESVPGSPGRAPSREPAEMTYDAVIKELEREYATTPGFHPFAQKLFKEAYGIEKPLTSVGLAKVARGGRDAFKLVHEMAIKEALASGKPVPPEVLADYPDLAKGAKEVVPEGVGGFMGKYGTARGVGKPEGLVSQEGRVARAEKTGDMAGLIRAYGGFRSDAELIRNFAPEEQKRIYLFSKKAREGVTAQGPDELALELRSNHPEIFGHIENGEQLLRAIADGSIYKKINLDKMEKDLEEGYAAAERKATAEGFDKEALSRIEADVERELAAERDAIQSEGNAGAVGEDFFAAPSAPKTSKLETRLDTLQADYPGIDRDRAATVIRALPNAEDGQIAAMSADPKMFSQVAKGNLSASEKSQLLKNSSDASLHKSLLGEEPQGGVFEPTPPAAEKGEGKYLVSSSVEKQISDYENQKTWTAEDLKKFYGSDVKVVESTVFPGVMEVTFPSGVKGKFLKDATIELDSTSLEKGYSKKDLGPGEYLSGEFRKIGPDFMVKVASGEGIDTLAHEGVGHMVYEMFATPREKAALLKKWGDKESIANGLGGEFVDWIKAGGKVGEPANLTIFQKAKDFFTKFLDAVHPTWKSVLRKMQSGEIYGRVGKDGKIAVDPQYKIKDDITQLNQKAKTIFEDSTKYTSWLKDKITTPNLSLRERYRQIMPEVTSEDMTYIGKLGRLMSWKAKEDPDAAKIWDITKTARMEVPSQLRVNAMKTLEPLLSLRNPKDLAEVGNLLMEADKINQSGKSQKDQQESFDNLLTRAKKQASPQVYEAFASWHRFATDSWNLDAEKFKALGIPAADILKLRQEMGRLTGYFPHIWDDGKYYIMAYDKTGEPLYRDVAGRHTLGKKLDEIKKKFPGAKVDYGKNEGLPEDLFFALSPVHSELLARTAVQKAGLDAETADKLVQVMADSLKARGFGAHYIKRQNVPGYITDPMRIPEIVTQYVQGWSGWRGKMEAAPQYFEALGKIDVKSKPKFYSFAENYVRDALENSTRTDKALGKLRNVMYLKYIPGVISTATLNMTQPFVTLAPFMSTETKGSFRKVTVAMKDLVKDGKAYWQFINGKEANWKYLKPEESKAMRDIFATGHMQDYLTKELLGNQLSVGGKLWEKSMDVLSFPFSNAEKYNRAVSALMAFRVYRNENGLDYDTAMKKAAQVVDDTQFVYGKYNLPEVARTGSAGKAFRSTGYVFKQYIQNYGELLAHLAKQPGGLKAIGKSAGVIALLGGPVSMPLVSTMLALAKGLGYDPVAQMFNGTDKEKNTLYTLFRFGIPGLLGVDFSGPIAVQLPGEMTKSLGEFSTDVLLGPPGRILASDIPKMIDAMHRGETGKAVEAIAPRFAKLPMQGIREGTEGVTTKRGQQVADIYGRPIQLTPTESLTRSLGFMPTRSTIRRESQEYIYEHQQARQEQQDVMATRAVTAIRNQNPAALHEVMQEITQYNQEAVRRQEPIIELDKLIENRMKPKMTATSWRGFELQNK